MKMNFSKWAGAMALISSLAVSTFAQNKVTVNPHTQKFLGENTSQLDRDKFLQSHMFFNKKDDAEFLAFKADYKINPEYFGSRRFWSPLSTVKKGVPPKLKNKYKGVRETVPFTIATGRATKFFYDRSVDYTEADVAQYSKQTAAFIAADYRQGWDEVPSIYEPFNEPMVHVQDLYPGKFNKEKNNLGIIKISEALRDIGKAVHAIPELQNMKVAGFASAWPEFELNDFTVWDTRFRTFIDIAGRDMDIFSVHLYDGKGLNNSGGRRSGANAEAILDMIEAYSFLSMGEVKPFAITEYGRLVVDQPDWKPKNGLSNYEAVENAQAVRSQLHMALAFMEREDNLVCAVVFSTGKQDPKQKFSKASLWTKNENDTWELTPRKYFFEILNEIKGQRVAIHSGNVDIQSQAFIDGKQMYVVLNNLNDNTQTIDLDILDTIGLKNVEIKRLKTFIDKIPELSEEKQKEAPAQIDIDYGETIVLTYNYTKDIKTKQQEYRTKYYATKYLKPIEADQANTFEFENVYAKDKVSATLRVGVGRSHGKSLVPTIIVNDQKVELPEDIIRGDDQHNRKQFFGVLEIPVPVKYLTEGTNKVEVTFSDEGGHVSSAILHVNTASKNQQI